MSDKELDLNRDFGAHGKHKEVKVARTPSGKEVERQKIFSPNRNFISSGDFFL